MIKFGRISIANSDSEAYAYVNLPSILLGVPRKNKHCKKVVVIIFFYRVDAYSGFY